MGISESTKIIIMLTEMLHFVQHDCREVSDKIFFLNNLDNYLNLCLVAPVAAPDGMDIP